MLLFSCKKEEKGTDMSPYILNQYRNSHQLPTQKFQANAAATSTLITKKGIWMSIPAGAFANQNGSPVTSGTIDISIDEYFSNADMVFGKVSTTAHDNTILITGGMFKITASQNGSDLKMNAGQTIRVAIPSAGPNDGAMQIFKGAEISDAANRVVWDITTIKWTGIDTPIGNQNRFYDFMINDLKWWNLDKYHDLGNGRTKMSVTLPGGFSNINAFTCLIMPNNGAVHLVSEGSVSQGFNTGNYTVPIGMQVKVLSVGAQQDKLYFNITDPITVTNEMKVTVPALTQGTQEQVTNAIQGL
jgi:hypothetical protein